MPSFVEAVERLEERRRVGDVDGVSVILVGGISGL
jgi:hypothetical protein